jgi:hypothetical protein
MSNEHDLVGALAFCGQGKMGIITHKVGILWKGVNISTGSPWQSSNPTVVQDASYMLELMEKQKECLEEQL